MASPGRINGVIEARTASIALARSESIHTVDGVHDVAETVVSGHASTVLPGELSLAPDETETGEPHPEE